MQSMTHVRPGLHQGLYSVRAEPLSAQPDSDHRDVHALGVDVSNRSLENLSRPGDVPQRQLFPVRVVDAIAGDHGPAFSLLTANGADGFAKGVCYRAPF